MLEKIDIGLIELLATIIMGVFSFFVTRLLGGYDRRISRIEERQEQALQSIAQLDRHVVKIATRMEMDKRN